MHSLDLSADLSAARALLDGLPYSVQAYAILSGVADGRVWVDRPDRPRVLLGWDGHHNVYLACQPDQTHRSLGIALFKDLEATLSGQVLAPGALVGQWGYVLHHGPAHMSEPLARELLRGREPLIDFRRIYLLTDPPQGAVASRRGEELEPGCAIEPVDASFLADSRRPNHGQVVDWIGENWRSVEVYLEHGFGYALTCGGEIQSWCMAEYVGAGPDGQMRTGIGIETVPTARNRGYGTRLARRFVGECLRREIIPHWECWNDNRASIAVAEKAGFALERTYPVRFAWHNVLDQAVVHLRVALGRNDLRAARGWLERVLERQAGPAAATARLWPSPEVRRQLEEHAELAQLLSAGEPETGAARAKEQKP